MIRKTMKTAGLLLLAVSFGYSTMQAAATEKTPAQIRAEKLAALKAARQAAGRTTSAASTSTKKAPSTSSGTRQPGRGPARQQGGKGGKVVYISKYKPNNNIALLLKEFSARIQGDNNAANSFRHCLDEVARIMGQGGWENTFYKVADHDWILQAMVLSPTERRKTVAMSKTMSRDEAAFFSSDTIALDAEQVELAAQTGTEITFDDVFVEPFEVFFSSAERPSSVQGTKSPAIQSGTFEPLDIFGDGTGRGSGSSSSSTTGGDEFDALDDI